MGETENWNWQTSTKNQREFFKGPEGQTEDIERIGKLKLLQIIYQVCDMIEIIYEAEFFSR